MFQSTLTGKFVTFQEYLMIVSEPSSYGGETREPKSWKISHTKLEKKNLKKKEKIKIYKSIYELFTNQIQFL